MRNHPIVYRSMIVLLAVAGPATAFAQAAPPAAPAASAPAGAAAGPISVGSTVYHTSGEAVGTVKAVTPAGIVVSTGNNEVTIPPGSFGAGPNGPVLAATRADIDNAAGAANAQRRTEIEKLLVAGASIRGAAGNVVGTVKSRDGDFAVVTSPAGEVRLPVTAFATGADGLRISLTAAEFDAAVAAARGAQPPA